jgi:hypothetical protein
VDRLVRDLCDGVHERFDVRVGVVGHHRRSRATAHDPRLVGPILGLSLVAFTLAVRYGIRARKRIKAFLLASSAAVDGRHRDALDAV